MTNQVRFTHVNNSNRLRYTVAYNFQKNTDGTLDVSYGVAQCNKSDSFTRAAGRALATGRLNKLNAKASKATSALKVPMSGKFTVADTEGLRIGQLVTERFEADRKRVMLMLDGQQ